MNKPKYELFEHTADMGMRVYGKDEKGLFVNAVFAMMDVMLEIPVLEPSDSVHGIEHIIELDGLDYGDLFVKWLSEFLYLMEVKYFLPSQIEIDVLNPDKIKAICRGGKVDFSKTEVKAEIKAVTYHYLTVCQRQDEWFAQVIFDM